MAILITTTGTQSTITFDDLGGRTISHPTSNLDLTLEFDIDDIRKSNSIQSELNAGTITASWEGRSITDLSILQADKELFSTTQSGLVPTSTGGTNNFLRADGSWAVPSGGGGGGSPRISGSVTTTTATPSLLDTIDTLTNPGMHIIEVFITARATAANAEWGVWKRTLAVSNFGGTVTIRQVSSDMDKSSTGLKATSVVFNISGSTVNINVTGIAATTIDWDSNYEIISVS